MVKTKEFDLDVMYNLKEDMSLDYGCTKMEIKKGSEFSIVSYGVDKDSSGYFFYTTLEFEIMENIMEITLFNDDVYKYI